MIMLGRINYDLFFFYSALAIYASKIFYFIFVDLSYSRNVKDALKLRIFSFISFHSLGTVVSGLNSVLDYHLLHFGNTASRMASKLAQTSMRKVKTLRKM